MTHDFNTQETKHKNNKVFKDYMHYKRWSRVEREVERKISFTNVVDHDIFEQLGFNKFSFMIKKD